MPLLQDVFKDQKPPYRIKIFAPNGETRELLGWLGLRTSPSKPTTMELFLIHGGDCPVGIEVINKKVVVVNQELGQVIYDPRQVPRRIYNLEFLTEKEVEWLGRNPQWPDILELKANPVENGEENHV